MFCREHVAQLRDIKDAIQERGAQLLVIGNGNPRQARAFRDEWKIDFPMLVDTGLDAFRAAGLRRGLGATFNRKVFQNARRAMKAGFRQGAVQGDPWQQGGTFVIDATGQVVFAHISQEGGDHASTSDVLDQLDQLTVD